MIDIPLETLHLHKVEIKMRHSLVLRFTAAPIPSSSTVVRNSLADTHRIRAPRGKWIDSLRVYCRGGHGGNGYKGLSQRYTDCRLITFMLLMRSFFLANLVKNVKGKIYMITDETVSLFSQGVV